ncbi:MAG: diaminopimelate decarboxylase [Gudongella sp.]|nr:diaminopimelate decarboxylase [Gudongella sp.]
MIFEERDGRLYYDGCDTVSLAKKYGTPLYVYSLTDIHNRIEELRNDFLDKYSNTRVAYAAKAFSTSAMLKLIQNEGLSLDVVSGGELYAAISVGFPGERIEFNGNNKLYEELLLAIEYGVGRIIVDGMEELQMIEEICKATGSKAKIMYRITPGVNSETHKYITTGKRDSKFGIPLEEQVFYPAVEDAIRSPWVEFLGLHFHVGSQIFDNQSHMNALDVLLDHVDGIRNRFAYEIREINLGGGFGIRYTHESRKPLSYFIDPMMEMIISHYEKLGLERPAVVIEPGRSVVGEAGITLYTIGSIKDIEGIRKYVSVDGGMTDNIRPALYKARHTGVIANKMVGDLKEKVTICGKCCESGDILISDIAISEPEPGDVFCVFSTGAYGYSMASNYNMNPIPAVVFIKDGRDDLVVKRQTYQDMLRNDIVPSWME